MRRDLHEAPSQSLVSAIVWNLSISTCNCCCWDVRSSRTLFMVPVNQLVWYMETQLVKIIIPIMSSIMLSVNAEDTDVATSGLTSAVHSSSMTSLLLSSFCS